MVSLEKTRDKDREPDSTSYIVSSISQPTDEVSLIADRWSMPSRQIRLLRTNKRTIDRSIGELHKTD